MREWSDNSVPALGTDDVRTWWAYIEDGDDEFTHEVENDSYSATE